MFNWNFKLQIKIKFLQNKFPILARDYFLLVMDLKNKHIAKTDIIVILAITLSQLLFCLGRLFISEMLKTDVKGINYDLLSVLWIAKVKINLIILLIIWYFSSVHWWKIAIVVPLTIEIFKLVSLFNPNVEVFDEIDFLTSLPIVFPLFLMIILLAQELDYYINSRLVYDSINLEIENTFSEISVKNANLKMEKAFYDLKSKKKFLDKQEYLNELIKLRDNIC